MFVKSLFVYLKTFSKPLIVFFCKLAQSFSILICFLAKIILPIWATYHKFKEVM